MVGGTGLYLRAALTELDLRPPAERDVREGLGARAGRGRPRRAARAALGGDGRHRASERPQADRAGARARAGRGRRRTRLGPALVGRAAAPGRAVRDRDGPRGARCPDRSRARAEMLAGGAVEEVETALERGASRTARKALGFKEIAAHLAGEASLDEVRERIERGHRAYVRRQLTWMRKLSGVEVIDRTGICRRARWRSGSSRERHAAGAGAGDQRRPGSKAAPPMICRSCSPTDAVIVGPDLSRLAEGRDACVESYVDVRRRRSALSRSSRSSTTGSDSLRTGARSSTTPYRADLRAATARSVHRLRPRRDPGRANRRRMAGGLADGAPRPLDCRRLDPPVPEVAGARQRLHHRRARPAAVRADARARAAHVRAHLGCHSDGVLVLSPPGDERFVARAAHLQPRRLRGRAVGQRRPRGDPLPAPRGVDRQRRVLDRDRGR